MDGAGPDSAGIVQRVAGIFQFRQVVSVRLAVELSEVQAVRVAKVAEIGEEVNHNRLYAVSVEIQAGAPREDD